MARSVSVLKVNIQSVTKQLDIRILNWKTRTEDIERGKVRACMLSCKLLRPLSPPNPISISLVAPITFYNLIIL